MKWKIGAIQMEMEWDHEAIGNHISHLLRYHQTDGGTADCAIRFERNETLARNTYDLRRDGSYLCQYASNFLENAPQRFYYRVLFPVLQQVCCDHEQIAVHRSLLGLPDGDSILVMGPSGGGKSTCAAAWLNAGLPLMGDDTIFLAKNHVFPLKRELHISEDSLSRFPRLKETENLAPYMPGYTKLGYDWIALYPELVLEVAPLPKLIVCTAVSPSGPTTHCAITDPQQKRELFQSHVPTYTPLCFANAWKEISSIPFVAVTWGRDIWEYPEMHVGYLKTLLRQETSRQ